MSICISCVSSVSSWLWIFFFIWIKLGSLGLSLYILFVSKSFVRYEISVFESKIGLGCVVNYIGYLEYMINVFVFFYGE